MVRNLSAPHNFSYSTALLHNNEKPQPFLWQWYSLFKQRMINVLIQKQKMEPQREIFK